MHKHKWDTTTEDDTLTKTCACGRTAKMTLTLISIAPVRDEAPVQDDAMENLHATIERVLSTSGHIEWKEETK